MGAKETIVQCENPWVSNAYFKEKSILVSLINRTPARAISNIIDFPNALSVERFAGGRVDVYGVVVEDSSGLCQMPITDFRKFRLIAMERDHQLMIPSGDVIIKTG